MGVRLRNWLSAVADLAGEDPKLALELGAYYAYVGLWLTASSRVPVGTNVYDREWDLLVILDACRVDALRAVADEFDFLGAVGSVRSVGSTSAEWVAHTFDRARTSAVAETAYVTANPHSQAVLGDRNLPPQYVPAPVAWPSWDPVEPHAFARLEEVWRDGRSERLGIVPPRETTDRAIRVGRETRADRLVVHYMQPHAPYIGAHVDAEGPPPEHLRQPLDALRAGRLDRETAWDAYLDNLRLVLEEVGRLLRNVDADRVAITADHGEAFGEWGFHEHPVGCPHPAVKTVPWAETTAVDTGAYEPASGATGDDAVDAAEQLADLGYL